MRELSRFCFLCVLLLSIAVVTVAQSPVNQKLQKSLLDAEVYFRFDNSQLDLQYMNNANAFSRFSHVVDSIGLQKIDSVIIVSQSSPEGVYEYNVKLSHRRAETMRQAIVQRHPELSNRLYLHADGESWARLRENVANDRKMKQTTIDQVLRIIDADVSVDTKKWRMQQLPIYRYLLQTHYPRIRNSVFFIVYVVEEEPVIEVVEEVVEEVIPVPEETPVEIVEETPAELPVETLVVEEFDYEPLLNVHTNLLYDAATMVNVGVEYYPRNSRWTIAANYTFPWWSRDKNHRYMQAMDGELQVRRYFDKTSTHTGHYLMAYGHGNLYDFSLDAKRAWQGEGWGIGLGYGYVWQPWKNKQWKLEAFVRLGYYYSVYDPYHASDPYNGKYYYDWEGAIEDFERRNHRLRWLGPTGVGVTLSYDLNWRKVKKDKNNF